MTRRGDVVVAVFPYVGGGASKNRLPDALKHKLNDGLKAAL